MHDLGQSHEAAIIGELELLDQHVERALPVPMGVFGTLCVVRMSAFALGCRQHLVAWHEYELGVGIDEPLDQPWARDPINVGVLSCDPLHSPSFEASETAARPSRFT